MTSELSKPAPGLPAQQSGQPVICLMGPTAAGKTALAMELVARLPCDIVSVDSAMIYRGMDIGTAKPDAQELARAPHRLIDIRDPAEAYSAAEFRADALREIEAIQSAGRIPLLVGGTMLYFNVLQKGIAELPKANAQVRERLLQEAEMLGWDHLHARLQAVDPVSAARIHPNDPQRLQRALEVYEVSGQTLTELWAQQEAASRSPWRYLSLSVETTERATLHERIARRFRLMLEQGFEAEVRTLFERPDLHPGLPSIRCVGYRQMWEYFEGRWDYEQMIERGIIATRQLAKRQVTWLRSWPDLHRFRAEDPDLQHNVLKLIDSNLI